MLTRSKVEHHMIGRVEAALEGREQDSGSDNPNYTKSDEAGVPGTTP